MPKKKSKKLNKTALKLKKYLLISAALVGIIALQVFIYQKYIKKDPNVHAQALSASYPNDTQLSQIAFADFPQPGYLIPIIEPNFGTTIRRVSDMTVMNTTQTVLRHAYSKIQAWNSDGTLLMLSYANDVYLLDGSSYAYLRTMNRRNHMLVWSNTKPLVAFDRTANQLLQVNMANNTQQVLHTFTEYDSISIGEAEGNISNNDSLVVLMAKKGANTYVVSYNLVTNTVLGTYNLNGQWPDWASSSQSGRYVVVMYHQNNVGSGKGVDVFDPQMKLLTHLTDLPEHGDLGYDTAGNEVLVQFDSNTWDIIGLRLDGGGKQVYKKGNWTGTHLSCRNLNRPGWCYISDDQATRKLAGANEIYALKLDGSQTVERFAYQHQSPLMPYQAAPMATVNRTGTAVLWASNWKLGASAPVYAYVAEYPGTAIAPSQSPRNSPTPALKRRHRYK